MIYKVWIACEQYDTVKDEAEPWDLDLDFASTADFDNEEEATAFARLLHQIGELISR